MVDLKRGVVQAEALVQQGLHLAARVHQAQRLLLEHTETANDLITVATKAWDLKRPLGKLQAVGVLFPRGDRMARRLAETLMHDADPRLRRFGVRIAYAGGGRPEIDTNEPRPLRPAELLLQQMPTLNLPVTRLSCR